MYKYRGVAPIERKRGALPHRKGARGAAPNPASFLKRKRKRRISRKRRFRRGIIDFLGSALLLDGRI